LGAECDAWLALARRAYVPHDPRWPERRRKLAAAQEVKRMTLFDNEVAAIVALRQKGRICAGARRRTDPQNARGACGLESARRGGTRGRRPGACAGCGYWR
jgi:hypothetical protein